MDGRTDGCISVIANGQINGRMAAHCHRLAKSQKGRYKCQLSMAAGSYDIKCKQTVQTDEAFIHHEC